MMTDRYLAAGSVHVFVVSQDSQTMGIWEELSHNAVKFGSYQRYTFQRSSGKIIDNSYL
jgi:hypothetical protein